MKKIIFATNNKNKAAEIRMILGEQFDIITLKEAGIDIDIPEPFHTLKENAIENLSNVTESNSDTSIKQLVKDCCAME